VKLNSLLVSPTPKNILKQTELFQKADKPWNIQESIQIQPNASECIQVRPNSTKRIHKRTKHFQNRLKTKKTSTRGRFDTLTLQSVNASTLRPVDVSTRRRGNALTRGRVEASTRRCIDASTRRVDTWMLPMCRRIDSKRWLNKLWQCRRVVGSTHWRVYASMLRRIDALPRWALAHRCVDASRVDPSIRNLRMIWA